MPLHHLIALCRLGRKAHEGYRIGRAYLGRVPGKLAVKRNALLRGYDRIAKLLGVRRVMVPGYCPGSGPAQVVGCSGQDPAFPLFHQAAFDRFSRKVYEGYRVERLPLGIIGFGAGNGLVKVYRGSA